MMPVAAHTVRSSHRLFLVTVILLSSVLLLGCSSASNAENNASGRATGLDAIQFNSDDSRRGNTTRTPEEDRMAQSQVRTLEDFDPIEGDTVVFTTPKGEITIELFRDQAPLTTTNFLTLVDDGFYDGQRFHRIINDFVVQFGDPLSKDESQRARWGTGGPDYVIEDEFDPALRHDAAGILSMANRGPNTGSSQVFITLSPQPHLDDKHAVFGQVTDGMDVVRSLEVGDSITSARIVE